MAFGIMCSPTLVYKMCMLHTYNVPKRKNVYLKKKIKGGLICVTFAYANFRYSTSRLQICVFRLHLTLVEITMAKGPVCLLSLPSRYQLLMGKLKTPLPSCTSLARNLLSQTIHTMGHSMSGVMFLIQPLLAQV